MLFSQATLRHAKREKIDTEDLQKDHQVRKRIIDETFERLRKRVLVPAPTNGQEVMVAPPVKGLKTSFPGRIVALLSTGETGIVVERPNQKCLVKLDKDGSTLKVCWDSLFWLKRCNDADDAVAQIFRAVCNVPQVSDISFGAHVSLVKLNYQSGTVEKLPVSKKNCCFMVRMDVSGQLVRSKAECMRLIAVDHPHIGPLFEKAGRPKAEVVKEKRKKQVPEMLRPRSKSSMIWMQSLKPPKVLPPPRALTDNVMSDSENSDEDDNDDDEEEEDNFQNDDGGGGSSDIENDSGNFVVKQTEFLL